MDVLIVVLQVVVLLAAAFAWYWLKGLPDSLHRKNEQLLQQELNRQLEIFKTDLSRELELLKISRTELQVRKTERFIEFGKLQNKMLVDKEFLDRIKRGDEKAVSELQADVVDLGVGLFFFASDEAVRDYGSWKVRSAQGELEGPELLRELGRLMVVLRKDLGYSDTILVGDDFLRLFITDWDQHAGS
jgi:hypothetical protein